MAENNAKVPAIQESGKNEKKDIEIVPLDDDVDAGNILPSIPSKNWIDRFSSFLADYDRFIDSQMKNGIDYGVIPGTSKPTLYLAGAQKLEKLFFLRSENKLIEKTISPDYGFVKYSYRTIVYRGLVPIATCEGTCNSKERKYRLVNGKERQDCYDIENTIMKMAQKRSYVGAILIATNSSSRFMQDMEDGAVVLRKAAPVRTVPARSAQPAQIPANGNGNGYRCNDCGKPITAAEYEYSRKNYHNLALCRACQAKYKKRI